MKDDLWLVDDVDDNRKGRTGKLWPYGYDGYMVRVDDKTIMFKEQMTAKTVRPTEHVVRGDRRQPYLG
jgi:hypothetical protein